MTANSVWTIQRILQWTTQYFKIHHIEEARLDAELLLAHVLKKTRIYLYTNFEQILNKSELSEYHALIEKRVQGLCVAVLTGHKSFMGLDFYVNKNVLIPRPDTEEWVEKVIQRYRTVENFKVLDLGTGSGVIVLSFLTYCIGATAVGIDISDDALDVAKKNGVLLSLSERVEWRQGDFLKALKEDELFDGIFSNPPYIPTGEIETLAKEVRHEPYLALDGGIDGLNFYRLLVNGGANHLKPGGFLAFEVGVNQAKIVETMLQKTELFTDFEIIKDLNGIERAIYCRKK
ncbi:MAG: peptide chain release factor N(5)-glutamine methyltransferase [Dialister pneumosintes]